MTNLDPSLETLQQSAKEAFEAGRKSKRLYLYAGVLRVYATIGVAIMICSLAVFGYTFVKDSLTTDQQRALAVAGAGGAISLLSILSLVLVRYLEQSRADSAKTGINDYDLVRGWARFEESSKRILTENGETFNTRSPRSILMALESHGWLPADITADLMTALQIRNRVVHESGEQPRGLVQYAISIIQRANDYLEARRGAQP